MRMRSRGCNGRHSQRVLLFLARRTLDADVAVELTAETLAPALSSWLAAVAGVDAGARAGLAVYGGAAPVRPVSADGRFVIEHSGHHWLDALQASGLPPAELWCACRDLSCVDQRGTSACLDTPRSHLPAPTP